MPNFRTWHDNITEFALRDGWKAEDVSKYLFEVYLPAAGATDYEIKPGLTEEDVLEVALNNIRYADFFYLVMRRKYPETLSERQTP
jgi:hypothetical protein